MREFFLISSAAMSLFAVGCTSPRTLCESEINMACERTFECASDELKSSDYFKTAYGTNVAECKTLLDSAARCAEKKDFDDLCPEGMTLDMSNALECDETRKSQSCAEYMNTIPAVCYHACNSSHEHE